MKIKKWQQLVFRASLSLCITSLILLIVSIVAYWQSQRQNIESAKLQTRRETIRAALEIERELRESQGPILSLASLLTNSDLSDEEISARVKQNLSTDQNLLNLGVAYRLFGYDQDTMLYAPGYVRKNNQIYPLQLEEIFDYTSPNYPWFRSAIVQGEHWGEPYYWQDNQFIDVPVFGFYSAFYRREGNQNTPQGVVYGEFSFAQVKEIMDSLNLGKNGYGFLLSKQGVFITHPNQQNVESQRRINNLLQQQNNEYLINFVSQAFAGKAIETAFIDAATGQKSWLFLKPMAINGWVVGVVFIEQEVLIDSQTKRRIFIAISSLTVIFLCSLSSLLFKVHRGHKHRLWMWSNFVSFICIVQMVFVWRLALAARNYLSNRIVLFSDAELEKLLIPQNKLSQQLNQPPPLKVPTGIFIQSLSFVSSNEVFISAYIWQKYQQGIHDDIERGFVLPDALDANDKDIQEVYNYQDGDQQVVGWYVETTLRQDFNFSKYPFDHKDVEIQIWHQEFGRQVILVPDFDAYELINPKLTPGINSKLVLYGWELESSFFEYRFKDYNANFGLAKAFDRSYSPQLYFTISVKREFIGPLVSRLVALVCVAALLFAMLLIVNEERAMEVLAVAAGLIFIVIVDQIAIREEIAAGGLIYFDYFYFVIYLFIFFVGVNALMLVDRDSDSTMAISKNNLLAKLLYWPSLTGILLFLTILVFF